AFSARALGHAEPEADIVRNAVDDVIIANVDEIGPLGRLRITYTAGVAPLGSDRGDAVPTLVVAASSTKPWPEDTTVATVPWVRNERSAVAAIKTTSYAENVVALAAAHDAGASEAILANTVGELCEGTGTNIFVVIDGRVLTPPTSSGCLAGITRDLVIEWFGAQEESMSIDVLQSADELFLTSSTRNVHPIVKADDRTWSLAGPISRDLRAAFDEQATRDIDP
ncbi:MAG: aminotransferase class IV, partial [bacterium]|nr:aminotransferase class IV [bacterium]